MDNGAYDEGTEEPEHRIHDQSSKKISDSRHSLEDKSYEDNNKEIARRSKPKVQEASDRTGRAVEIWKNMKRRPIKDGATKTSNRNRKYEEEREHESRQNKAPIKASDRRSSSRGSIGSQL